MELTIYALIYWNVNFKIEVTKMLNKKLFSTSLVLSILLVGCSSVKENEVKENKEKVEEVEVQVQEEKNVESNESVPVVQEYSNNQVQEYSAPIEENSNDTYVPEVKETPQPEDNGEREIVLVREEIPACDEYIKTNCFTFLMMLYKTAVLPKEQLRSSYPIYNDEVMTKCLKCILFVLNRFYVA